MVSKILDIAIMATINISNLKKISNADNNDISSKVRVCVRCRPLTIKEARGRRCLNVLNDQVLIGDKSYSFDEVYDENSTQADVYTGCISSLVEGCFKGFNATILAYGN